MTCKSEGIEPRIVLRKLFDAAVGKAQPELTIGTFLPPPPQGRTVVIGAGKAAAAMAHAVDRLWPKNAPLSGLVVTRYGHIPARPTDSMIRIDIAEAAHPVPDEAGRDAAVRMLKAVEGLRADDLVLCLMSGGGSALLTLPADGLDFHEKQKINQDLLLSGAHIGEMNCVRKHLSKIKGGRLAVACAPAQLLTLVISDVPGDDPEVIASGPTVPDSSTAEQALGILQRYKIEIPDGIREQLEKGDLETPKDDDPAFVNARIELIATPWQSLVAAAECARAMGLPAHILSDEVEGESREVGKVHAALARSVARRNSPFTRPCVILSGGETTVTVKPQTLDGPRGRGGRAGEFCLGLAQALQGEPNIWALAADTDGIDGVEDNAGVFVTPDTLARAEAAGMSISSHLDRNDAYGYFQGLGDLLVTGPTHTNVNDFRAIFVD